jgi:Flp pilus assembly pilin Flp
MQQGEDLMTLQAGRIATFLSDERGEDLIEYALVVAFVAGVAIALILSDPFGVKGALVGAFQKAKDALDAA